MNLLMNKLEELIGACQKHTMEPSLWKERLALAIIFLFATVIFGSLVLAMISIVSHGLWWFPVGIIATFLLIWAIKYIDKS